MLGSGGVVVLDDTTCIVKFALRTMKFYQHESCGWCIPCREGTDWLKKTLIRFHSGGGVKKDIDNMQYLSENMLGRTFCPLGDAAAMPTMAFIKKFRKEFEDHLDGKPCPFEKAARAGDGVENRVIGHWSLSTLANIVSRFANDRRPTANDESELWLT